MKTHLILLCAIGLGGGLVDGATNPINPSQDKQPTVLYVSGYNPNQADHWQERSDYYDGNGDHRVEIWQDSQRDMQWSDGGGGGIHGLESYQAYYSDWPDQPVIWSCELQAIWPATTGPDLVSGTVTEDTCGTTVPREYPGPTLFQEHCVVKDPTNYTVIGDHSVLEVDDIYNRKADTKMTLLTGGKGVPGRQNLFMISGSANEILDKRGVPPFGNTVRARSVPAQNIQFLYRSRRLGILSVARRMSWIPSRTGICQTSLLINRLIIHPHAPATEGMMIY